jgi:hypothetical protein
MGLCHEYQEETRCLHHRYALVVELSFNRKVFSLRQVANNVALLCNEGEEAFFEVVEVEEAFVEALEDI